MIYAILGIASAIIFLLGDIPYLRDTLTGKTKPHRVTWGIVSLLNGIGFANQYASGAHNSLWLFGAGTVMTGLIFLASLRSGVGGGSRADILCLIFGLAGVVLWVAFDSPWYSISANILADFAALAPTFIKARKHPETETKISWLVGGFSTLLATISVGKLDLQLLILPGLGVLLQAYMVYILYIETRFAAKR
ncbi:MAG TPA: hypothetical protein VLH84_00375 [Patescibacteria group bacterium]|nr:hypothetical protein [Patescibacteria group bacterium]